MKSGAARRVWTSYLKFRFGSLGSPTRIGHIRVMAEFGRLDLHMVPEDIDGDADNGHGRG